MRQVTTRGRPRPGFAARLAGLLAVALVAGGCGAEDPKAGGTSPELGRAAAATGAVRSLRIDTTLSFLLPMAYETVSIRGEYDRVGERSREVQDRGQAFVDRLNEDLDGDLPRDAERVIEIHDGSTRYVRSSLYNHLTGSEERWHRAERADRPDGGKLVPELVPDSTEVLEFLDEVSEATDLGRERVRGAMTSHARAEFDLRDLMIHQGKSRKEVEAEMRASEVDGPVPTQLDVWLDAQDRVRKLSMTLDLSASVPPEDRAEYAGIGFALTAEYYAFDEPVDIELPPPAEVGSYDPSVIEGD